MNRTGLNREILDAIVRMIREHKEPDSIIIYGSRARGDHEGVSDIDLAVTGEGWTSRDINIVKNLLEARIRTPLTFDLVFLSDITEAGLAKAIDKEGVVIYDAGKSADNTREL